MTAFDETYTQLCDELHFKGLHLFNLGGPIKFKRLLSNIALVEFSGRFNSLCVPPEHQIFAVIPLKGDLIFNSYQLEKNQIGMANTATPCLIQQPVDTTAQFIICKLEQSQRLSLLASTSMPVDLPLSLADLTSDSHQLEGRLKAHLLAIDPPLRPHNLRGRSRLPRKSFVRDFVLKICETLDTKVAIQYVCESYSISERTARDGFRDIAGVTPKQFMLLQQLFMYRKAILETSSGSIKDIAQQLKISTPGRIASQYHLFFGEKPNQTLVRVRNKMD